MALLLLISLLSLSLFAVPAARAAPPEPVYDSDGHPLRYGESYYVVSAIRGAGGGGLTLAQRHFMCPLYVAQERSDLQRGLPVTFSPVDSAAAADDTVRLSTDVNVQFVAVTDCVQSTVWQLGDPEGEGGQRFVVTGGVPGNPGPNTVNNWFKIEKVWDRAYKIVFCPSVCRSCEVECGDVGVVGEDGKRLLGLTDDWQFQGQFWKVKSKP